MLNQKEYITIVDKDYRYIYISKSYLEAMGLEPQDIIGKKISDIWKDKIVQNHILENINKALSGREATYRGNFAFNIKKTWYRVRYSPLVEKNGLIKKIVITTLNISEEIKNVNTMIKALRKDKLTQIHNRKAFDEDLQITNKKGKLYTLMLLDLDNFKHTNDKFGHAAGDLALVKCSKLFRKKLKPNGRLYRIGGDEFVAIIKDTKKGKLQEIAASIISELIDSDFNKDFHIGVSIGILSVKKTTSLSINDQIKLVDENMYSSKTNGKNKFTYSEI